MLLGQQIGRAASILVRFRLVRLDQGDQRLPWHYSLQLIQKLLPFSLLLGIGDPVAGEAELVAAITPILACNNKAIIPRMPLIFQSLLYDCITSGELIFDEMS